MKNSVEEEKSRRSRSSKNVYGIIVGVFVLVILLGVSLAVVFQSLSGTKKYVLVASDLMLYLDEEANLNDVVEANIQIPVTDKQGKETTGYQFSLVNKGAVPANYSIYLEENPSNTMPLYALRYNLTETSSKLDVTGNIEDLEVVDGSRKLYSTAIYVKERHDYELKIWLGVRAENDAKNKRYSVKIKVEVDDELPPYIEKDLNGTDPVLSDSLIPVMIANDGVVTRAKASDKWYDYTNKKWANAVVLEDSTQTYKEGDVINLDDIESYFVWIPRYKYKIFNDGDYTGDTSLNENAPQTIEIEFESKSSPLSNGTAKDEWLSHPAFQAFDTNGFWVGKFESSYRGATSTTVAEVDTADSTKLIIKPNSYSWRNITVGNMFKTSYEYLRDNESHMMKNTEWGAVAYLSHSQYGVNTEVYINNNERLLTGCGGDTASASSTSTCLNAYGSKADGVYNQSTTGNISGIFDMSGGAWEYVMGYSINASDIGGRSEITSLYSDFFDNNEWNKYYDKYASSSIRAYNNRILGDATGEMGPFSGYLSSWYSANAYFVSSSGPWFHRGGHYGNSSVAGVFNFDNGGAGVSGTNYSFRVVLSVTE